MDKKIVNLSKELKDTIQKTSEQALKKSDGSNKKAREYLYKQLYYTSDKDIHKLVKLTIDYLENEALSI